MGDKSKHLVREVRAARERLGLSQRALSERTGQTQSHISQIESGKMEPGMASFIDMARALGLELILVPTKLVPGVRALVRSQAEPDEAAEPYKNRAVTRALSLLKHIRDQLGASADLDHVDAALRFLRRTNLGIEESQRMDDVIDALAHLDHHPSEASSLRGIADKLQRLRNAVAHRAPAEPKPAYTLDGREDHA